MTTDTLKKLDKLNAKATQGEWRFVPSEWEGDDCIAAASPGDIFTLDLGDYSGMNDKDASLISALVNYFRSPEFAALRARAERPLDVVIHCPKCGLQHIDKSEPEAGWDNPPHKSHLCARCKTIWRPAEVATNGVWDHGSRGSADTWNAPEARAEQREGWQWVPKEMSPQMATVFAMTLGNELESKFDLPLYEAEQAIIIAYRAALAVAP